MAQDFTTPGGPVQEFPVPTPVPPKKNNTVWIVVAIVVVLLCCCCLVIAGVYLWNNGDNLFFNNLELPQGFLPAMPAFI